jgi:hypothetical protein
MVEHLCYAEALLQPLCGFGQVSQGGQPAANECQRFGPQDFAS